MKIKLQNCAIALCIALLGLANTAKATTYYYCGGGPITTTSSWFTTTGCTGSTHPVFTNPNNTYNFNTAGTYSLSSQWALGSGCIVNIGFGGAAVTLVTNGQTIKKNSGSTSIAINILASGVLDVSTSIFFTASNVIMSASAGSTVNYILNGATVGGGTYDNLTISANASLGGNVITVNNVLSNSAILTIAGSELILAGTTSGAGTISGDANSSFVYSGTTSATLNMDQTTSGTTNVLSSVENSGTGTLNIGNALQISPGGDITPTGGGTIATGGNVTLLAGQSGSTGSIGPITGSITGNITSQVYYDPSNFQTNWSLLGVAGISNATFNDWNNNFKVTCPSGCTSGDGSIQNGGTPFSSVTGFDEPSDSYTDISGNSTIAPGTGYWVYLGTAAPGTTNTVAVSISLTGTPVTGDVPVSITNNGSGADKGYNLVANPYPSPIVWASVYSENSNIDATIYLYSNADQDFATLNQDGGNAGTAHYDVSSGIIPTGEAFYVVASANTTLTFSEDQKGPGSTQVLGRLASGNSHSVQSTITPYFQIDADNGTTKSEACLSFNLNATLGVDNHDGLAKKWNGKSQISTVISGNYYAINGLPGFSQNYSVPVRILSATTGTYTISARNLQKIPVGPCLILHDNYGIMADQDLRAGACTVTINDSETVARFTLNITTTPLLLTTNSVQASCPATTDGLLTAVGNDAGPWNYVWRNANNVIVKTTLTKATADSLTGLNNGVYSVDVSTIGTCNSATQTFTVMAPSGPASAFTAPTQVNIGDNVTFINNSTNATNYVWDFGDGGISSQQTPSYVYNNPGINTITLYAIIASCNDTVSSTQIIEVDATTSIKKANSGSGDIYLSKDGSGNYLQFDYANQTKVNITVYNVLGQTLLNNAGLTIVNDKIYLNINDSKNQVLYVSITNLNTNQQTIKKFVNN